MYKYSCEQCDVANKTYLEVFRERRAQWIFWLMGDDQHSIWTQISSLLWDINLFQTINDLRRMGAEHPTSEVGFNNSVLRMLDAGFVATQVTSIRRLTDRQPRDPDKGVISLRRLVDEIQANRN